MSRPRPTVLQELKEHIPAKARVLVAVSGGLDSMVLLHGVRALQTELHLHIEVAHVDHGLRAESREDERFVQSNAGRFQLPYHSTRLDSLPEGQNMEAWGRSERYKFFKSVLNSCHLDWVLTAHTASDVAETLLMRLVSNKGLSSISRRDERRKVIRPLLSLCRADIEAFATVEGIEHREDPSNQDTTFLRNRVRHHLLPMLKNEFDLRIEEVLAHRAEVVALDNEALLEIAERAAIDLRKHTFGSREWLRSFSATLAPLHPAIQVRVVEVILKPVLGFNLGVDRCSDFARFIVSGEEGIQLPGGFEFRRRDGGIVMNFGKAV